MSNSSTIEVSVISESKAHVVDRAGNVIRIHDAARGTKSGEFIKMIEGFTAIASSSNYEWFSQKSTAMAHANKLAAEIRDRHEDRRAVVVVR